MQKSLEWWDRGRKVIPGATQTMSKGRERFVQGVYPIYLQRGDGARVWDVDGNEYVDMIGALGPMLLGYNYPAVNEAVIKQLKDGTVFSLPHPLEVEVAELICECVSSAEMVRFGKNGNDVTSASVRIARAYTGKESIAFCGYHGWQDWYGAGQPRNNGIPACLGKLIHRFYYNNTESIANIFAMNKDIAAVIMEQGGDEPENNFLHKVKELAHKNGALFILDEVVTGFRWALGGVQEKYGVEADLVCYGKAMANGFPLSAVAGKREYMNLLEDDVFFSLTFGGETLSLAAAKATIEELRKWPILGHIEFAGKSLIGGYDAMAAKIGIRTKAHGHYPRFQLLFDDPSERVIFMQECCKRGVLMGVPCFPTFGHQIPELGHVMNVWKEALEAVKEGVPLEGEPPQEVIIR